MESTRSKDIFKKLKEHDISVYFPGQKTGECKEPYVVGQVEEIMDELFPMFRPVHYRSPSFLDNEVKAHMISVQYVNYTKNTRR